MRALQTTLTAIRAWGEEPVDIEGSFAGCEVPLAGFSDGQEGDLDEVIQLAAWAPCSRVHGANGIWSVDVGSLESRADLIRRKLEALKKMRVTPETSGGFAACYSMY